MINDKKQITKKISQSDELKSQLIDEDEITKQEKLVNECKRILEYIQEKNNIIQKIDFYLMQYNGLKLKLEQINQKDLNFDSETANKFMEDIILCKNNIQKSDFICRNYNRFVSTKKQSEIIIQKYKDLDINIISYIKDLCNKIYLIEKYKNKYQNLSKQSNENQIIIDKYLELNKSDEILTYVKDKCNDIYKMNRFIQKSKNYFNDFSETNKQILKYEENLKYYKNKLDIIKQNNKVCPLCGKPYS